MTSSSPSVYFLQTDSYPPTNQLLEKGRVCGAMEHERDDDYNYLLILDLDPRNNIPHCSCITIDNTGIRSVHHGRLKLSKNFRLRPIQLPIYREKKMYHVIAKAHKSCTNDERNRANMLVNEHVSNCLKAGMTMDATVSSTVEKFPCRVLKGRNFGEMNEPLSRYGASSARHKPPVISSSDTDAFASDHASSTPKTAFPSKGRLVFNSLHIYLALPLFRVYFSYSRCE